MHDTTVSIALERYALRNGLKRGAQKDIAERLGVTRQTVRNWCVSNSVSLDYVEEFARITGAKASDLNKLTRRVCEG